MATLAIRREEWLDRIAFGVAVCAGGFAVAEAVFIVPIMHYAPVAGDLALYLDATRRWIAGGPFYPPDQLAGPYLVYNGAHAILYPPTAILLFAPFLVLPVFLWWAIPVSIVGWAIVRHRPSPVGWALVALGVADPLLWSGIQTGNPGLWVMAAVALGTHYGWPAVAVFIKPSVFPFALIGVRGRAWWIAFAAGLLLSLPFLPMFPDWIASMVNARGPRSGLLYSSLDVLGLSIPVVAWVFGERRPAWIARLLAVIPRLAADGPAARDA